MIVPSPKTLKRFRIGGYCECGCNRWCSINHASHIIPCGMGSGSRLDVPENLIRHNPLCHVGHHADHDPKERQAELFEIVARREKFPSGEAVREYLMMILRLPKGSKIPLPDHLLATKNDAIDATTGFGNECDCQ